MIALMSASPAELTALQRIALVTALAVGGSALVACGRQEAPADVVQPPAATATAESGAESSEFAPVAEWVQDFSKQEKLDLSVWRHELKPVVPTYNNEAQAYTDNERNVRIENGKLVIEAHRENYTDPSGRKVRYTSGRIDTRDSFNFDYGEITFTDVILPEGAGAWPAIWFLSANTPYTDALNPSPEDWERDERFYLHDGEVDLVETGKNGDTQRLEGTVHTYNGSSSAHRIVRDVSRKPHTLSIRITPHSIVWTIDGEILKTFKKPSDNPDDYPFGRSRLYPIINVAMGGDYAGKIDDSRKSWRMEIGGVEYRRYIGPR
jgi:beta-glucanase (GH16 family)